MKTNDLDYSITQRNVAFMLIGLLALAGGLAHAAPLDTAFNYQRWLDCFSWRGRLQGALLLALLLFTPSLLGATRTVTSLADNGPGSLRETITASVGGDTIDFAVAGTITLTNGELVIGRDLPIIGPSAGLTLSGDETTRIFYVIEGSTLNVSGLTLADGRADNGGAILCYRCALSVNNCTFTNNYASTKGGAIMNGAG